MKTYQYFYIKYLEIKLLDHKHQLQILHYRIYKKTFQLCFLIRFFTIDPHSLNLNLVVNSRNLVILVLGHNDKYINFFGIILLLFHKIHAHL